MVFPNYAKRNDNIQTKNVLFLSLFKPSFAYSFFCSSFIGWYSSYGYYYCENLFIIGGYG